MAKTLDEVFELAKANTTVGASLVTLVKGIKAQLDAALSGVLTPAQQAKVDLIFTEVEKDKTALETAILENTQSGPNPISELTDAQVHALTVAEIAAFTPEQAAKLSIHQLGELSAEQAGAITVEQQSLMSGFQKEQIQTQIDGS